MSYSLVFEIFMTTKMSLVAYSVHSDGADGAAEALMCCKSFIPGFTNMKSTANVLKLPLHIIIGLLNMEIITDETFVKDTHLRNSISI